MFQSKVVVHLTLHWSDWYIAEQLGLISFKCLTEMSGCLSTSRLMIFIALVSVVRGLPVGFSLWGKYFTWVSVNRLTHLWTRPLSLTPLFLWKYFTEYPVLRSDEIAAMSSLLTDLHLSRDKRREETRKMPVFCLFPGDDGNTSPHCPLWVTGRPWHTSCRHDFQNFTYSVAKSIHRKFSVNVCIQ